MSEELAEQEGALLGVGDDGIARLRLQGSCHGCPASAQTLELAIRQAIDEAAPDLVIDKTLPWSAFKFVFAEPGVYLVEGYVSTQ